VTPCEKHHTWPSCLGHCINFTTSNSKKSCACMSRHDCYFHSLRYTSLFYWRAHIKYIQLHVLMSPKIKCCQSDKLVCTLTNSIEQSSSWEADDAQLVKILSAFWRKPNIRYSVHKSLSFDPVLSHSQPISRRYILILSSYLRHVSQLVSSGFSTKVLSIYYLPMRATCLPTHPPPWFDRPNNIWWRA
jgi:hypothetical protein